MTGEQRDEYLGAHGTACRPTDVTVERALREHAQALGVASAE